jgi:hypothetical protein
MEQTHFLENGNPKAKQRVGEYNETRTLKQLAG